MRVYVLAAELLLLFTLAASAKISDNVDISSADHADLRLVDGPLSFDSLAEILEDSSDPGKEDASEDDKATDGDDKDCAETLSCKVGKGTKEHSEKAANGKYGQRKVNVKQIDTEEKSVKKTMENMHKSYKKGLVNGFGGGSGSGSDMKEREEKAKGVLGKDEERLQKKEDAKAKYEAEKEKAKEAGEKSLQKSKEGSEKKMNEKNSKSKDKANKPPPVTKEGLIQKAAEARFAAYKLKMKAAELQHRFAQKNATKHDVEKVDAAAKAAELAAQASEEKAVKHSLTEEERARDRVTAKKTKALKAKDKKAAKKQAEGKEAGGQAKKLLDQAGTKREKGTGKESVTKEDASKEKNASSKKANSGTKPNSEPEKDSGGTKDDAEPEKDSGPTDAEDEEENEDEDEEKASSALCSKNSCKKRCQTDLCFKFCMRCKKIKSEQVVFRAGIGLVTGSKSNVHHVTDPAITHAQWVNSSMQHLHNLEKRDADADKFANAEVMSVYCKHCHHMCASQRQKQQDKKTCSAACMASAACIKGGKESKEQSAEQSADVDPFQPAQAKSTLHGKTEKAIVEMSQAKQNSTQQTANEDSMNRTLSTTSQLLNNTNAPVNKNNATLITTSQLLNNTNAPVNKTNANAPVSKTDAPLQHNKTQDVPQHQQQSQPQQNQSQPQQTQQQQSQQQPQPQSQQQQKQQSQPQQKQQSQQQQSQQQQQQQQSHQPSPQEQSKQQEVHQDVHPLKGIEEAAARGANVHVIRLPTVTIEKVTPAVPTQSNEQQVKAQVANEVKEKVMEKTNAIVQRNGNASRSLLQL